MSAWIAVGKGIVAGFVVFAIWLLGTFIVHVLGAPARLYREKETEANKLKWDDVKFTTFKFPADTEFEYGLEITHDKEFDLDFVSARLSYLVNTQTKEHEYLNKQVSLLPWDGGSRKFEWTPVTIEKGGKKVLVILCRNDQGVWFPTETEDASKRGFHIQISDQYSGDDVVVLVNDKRTLINKGDYAFEIEFNAQVDGYELESYLFKGALSYDELGIKIAAEQSVLRNNSVSVVQNDGSLS